MGYWYNGQLSYNGNYKRGQKDKLWTHRDPKGQVVLKQNYTHSIYHGLLGSYTDDGALFEKGVYKNGLRHRRWTSYFKSGQLNPSFSVHVKNGEKVSD